MDIAAGIAAVTQGIGIAKTLRTIERTYDEATYRAKLAEVIEALADAKLALADAKEGMADREREIERLKADFQLRASLVSDRGDYKYIANEVGQPLGYPICPKCEVVDGRIVQMKQDGGLIHARCPACLTKFSPVTAYFTQKERDEAAAERQAEADRLASSLPAACAKSAVKSPRWADQSSAPLEAREVRWSQDTERGERSNVSRSACPFCGRSCLFRCWVINCPSVSERVDRSPVSSSVYT